MKGTRLFIRTTLKPKLLAVVCLALAASPALRAQTQAVEPATAATSPAVAEAEAVQRRLERARALAAIGRLAAAATELESLRATSGDESVRDVARLLLMSIFVEMPDYTRAAALLDEAFKARAGGRAGDATSHAYFAVAGQTVIAVRTHLDRYRNFGVNVADASDLPAEAGSDLDQLRVLLERVVTQAREIRGEQANARDTGALDATALLEDAATVRMRVPRNEQDRARWQTEVSEARQHLLASETRIASISDLPPARPAPATATATDKNNAQKTDPKRAGKQGQPPAAQPTPAAAATTASAPPPTPSPAPANSGAGNVVAVGSLVSKARQRVSPSYPAIARAARATGTVTVFLVVDEKGEVVSVERADGPVQLRTAATDAARRWKFNPTVVNGEPVRVSGYLSFNFAP
ncbi:MAG TPA: energy transducer TonB [Pyrinomonadaceae bacterium]|nr:energy transducer TonB [Pyrinomonadaceae bacterium]